VYYDNLPIFKSALDLVVYIETIVKGFEKYHKYTVGEDLRNYSKELMFLIQRANMSEERVSELVNLRNKCEEVKMLIRVVKELKAFKSFKQFEYSSKLTMNICRQAQAWLSKSAGVSR
jgi:hypothetical protein